ncbi:hypothetical protein OOO55_001391 [Salmonella enterica]|nr:hypothetical protein [Salmonella enterica]
MNLENKQIRELLAYASNNHFEVSLLSHCAIAEYSPGSRVFIKEGANGIFIYKGVTHDSCLILPEDFKQLFSKR